MQIKVINDSKKINDASNYKIKINNKVEESHINNIKEYKIINFAVGDKIKHKEEGILGEIKFVGQEKIAIVWEDNSRERIAIDEAINTLEYVDDIQSLISPLTPQITKNKEENDPSLIIEEALETLKQDDSDDMDDDNESIDIEKLKLQRKVSQLENKLTSNKTNSMKEKIAKDLIDVAIIKGMIESDDTDLEIQKILLMNDSEFEEYKTSVLEFDDSNIVTSRIDEPEKENLSEAEKMLNRIKGNGGKGIIGDFSKDTPTSSNVSINSGERRALSDIKDNKFSFNNQYTIPEFGEQFGSILNEKLAGKTSNQNDVNKEYEKQTLPGFENLKGLTKPLQINTKHSEAAFPTNTSIKELFSDLNWTILSK